MQKHFNIFTLSIGLLLVLGLPQPAAALTLGEKLSIAVNAARTVRHLAPLHYSYTLNRAALLQNQDMFRYGYFSHQSPTGRTYLYWVNKGPAHFQPTGENLGRNYLNATDVVNAWLGSTVHRANLLSTKMTHLGTAVLSGVMAGQRATIYILIVGKVIP